MAKHTQTICRQFANQWTSFYMIAASAMKELNGAHSISDIKLPW